jgi:hypothetical protein
MKKIEFLFLGVIAALGSLVAIAILAVIFQLSSPINKAGISELYLYIPSFVTLSALAEELSKYILLKKTLSLEKSEGFIISNIIFFGLGFSLIEAAFIFAGSGDGQNLAGNIFEITTIHISTSIIIAKIITMPVIGKMSKITYALAISLLVHLSYNFAIIYGFNRQASALSYVLSAIILTALGFEAMKKKATCIT